MSDFIENVRRLLAGIERERRSILALEDPPPTQPRTPVGPLAPPDCAAREVMLELNPHAFLALEGDELVALEDAWDCPDDGRLYRLEYRSTLDGRRAIAYCRSNPWDRRRVQAGQPLHACHVFDDGLLCLGTDHARAPARSPRDLRETVLRSRFWCTGFSVLMETGQFPDL
jgi:hypothetical protein